MSENIISLVNLVVLVSVNMNYISVLITRVLVGDVDSVNILDELPRYHT